MDRYQYPLVASALLLGLVACGSSESAEKPATESVAEVEAEGDLAWADRDHDQKVAFMKEAVLPTLGAMLTEHAPEDHAEVKCTACHGAGAMEGKFDMPNPSLPKLNPADSFKKHQENEPADLKFMMESFSPKMAEVLGVEPWSPENPKGFGCFNCHTMEEAPAAPAEGEAPPADAAAEDG